ncbi:MAG: hypothetical protein ACP5FT_03570 [Acidilobus sp.]
MVVIEGVYYEFIAVPCCVRATMPVGIFMGPRPTFYLYRGTRLADLLPERGRLRLLSPYDPIRFLQSLRHELEAEIDWSGGCPRPDERLGAWYECSYALASTDERGSLYSCDGLNMIAGSHVPYTRTYGCLVELLVLLTKARAGVWEEWYLPYAEGLAWCVRRSARGQARYVNAADEVLQELRSILKRA